MIFGGATFGSVTFGGMVPLSSVFVCPYHVMTSPYSERSPIYTRMAGPYAEGNSPYSKLTNPYGEPVCGVGGC